MMYILGIDPGKSGGMALLDIDGKLELEPFKFNKMTENDIANAFKLISCGKFKIHSYVEKVHTMPYIRKDKKTGEIKKQGISSTGKFMRGYGFLLGCLSMTNFTVTHITPQTWQKELQCRSGGDKNVTKQRAQELFPSQKITHSIADALLIAEYGRRQVVNQYLTKGDC